MTVPASPAKLADRLRALRRKRKDAKVAQKSTGTKRQSLSKSERQEVLEKTDGRCHICGDKVAQTVILSMRGDGKLGGDVTYNQREQATGKLLSTFPTLFSGARRGR